MTILILHCVGVPLTGASMNPARSFGPAVVNGCWDNHWIYWIGPLVGSTAASLIAQAIFLNSPDVALKILRINRANQENTTSQRTATPPSIHKPQDPTDYAEMKEEDQEIRI
jgi:hypothetical protein